MKGLWMVARREIVVRGRTKGYIIGLLVTVLLVAGLTLLPTLFEDDGSYTVAVTGENAAELTVAIEALSEDEAADLTVDVTEADDADAAREAVSEGDADVAIIDDEVMIADGTVPAQLSIVLDSAHTSVVSGQQLAEAGLDAEVVEKALSVEPLARESLEGDDSGARAGIAVIVVILMFFLLMSPTMYVAMGVVEEKSSRIVEILLSSLRTWQLLGGKILGLGVLGFINVVAIAAAGLGGAAATGFITELPPGVGDVAVSAVVWWVLAYAFFAALAGGMSSLVSRQEDISSALTPMTMLLTGAYLVSFFFVNDPGSVTATVLSYVPPFSAFMMPVREAGGDLPFWQSGLSMVIMLAASIGVLALAATIYKRSVMRMGSRVKLTEILTRSSAG